MLVGLHFWGAPPPSVLTCSLGAPRFCSNSEWGSTVLKAENRHSLSSFRTQATAEERPLGLKLVGYRKETICRSLRNC